MNNAFQDCHGRHVAAVPRFGILVAVQALHNAHIGVPRVLKTEVPEPFLEVWPCLFLAKVLPRQDAMERPAVELCPRCHNGVHLVRRVPEPFTVARPLGV